MWNKITSAFFQSVLDDFLVINTSNGIVDFQKGEFIQSSVNLNRSSFLKLGIPLEVTKSEVDELKINLNLTNLASNRHSVEINDISFEANLQIDSNWCEQNSSDVHTISADIFQNQLITTLLRTGTTIADKFDININHVTSKILISEFSLEIKIQNFSIKQEMINIEMELTLSNCGQSYVILPMTKFIIDIRNLENEVLLHCCIDSVKSEVPKDVIDSLCKAIFNQSQECIKEKPPSEDDIIFNDNKDKIANEIISNENSDESLLNNIISKFGKDMMKRFARYAIYQKSEIFNKVIKLDAEINSFTADMDDNVLNLSEICVSMHCEYNNTVTKISAKNGGITCKINSKLISFDSDNEKRITFLIENGKRTVKIPKINLQFERPDFLLMKGFLYFFYDNIETDVFIDSFNFSILELDDPKYKFYLNNVFINLLNGKLRTNISQVESSEEITKLNFCKANNLEITYDGDFNINLNCIKGEISVEAGTWLLDMLVLAEFESIINFNINDMYLKFFEEGKLKIETITGISKISANFKESKYLFNILSPIIKVTEFFDPIVAVNPTFDGEISGNNIKANILNLSLIYRHDIMKGILQYFIQFGGSDEKKIPSLPLLTYDFTVEDANTKLITQSDSIDVKFNRVVFKNDCKDGKPDPRRQNFSAAKISIKENSVEDVSMNSIFYTMSKTSSDVLSSVFSNEKIMSKIFSITVKTANLKSDNEAETRLGDFIEFVRKYTETYESTINTSIDVEVESVKVNFANGVLEAKSVYADYVKKEATIKSFIFRHNEAKHDMIVGNLEEETALTIKFNDNSEVSVKLIGIEAFVDLQKYKEMVESIANSPLIQAIAPIRTKSPLIKIDMPNVLIRACAEGDQTFVFFGSFTIIHQYDSYIFWFENAAIAFVPSYNAPILKEICKGLSFHINANSQMTSIQISGASFDLTTIDLASIFFLLKKIDWNLIPSMKISKRNVMLCMSKCNINLSFGSLNAFGNPQQFIRIEFDSFDINLDMVSDIQSRFTFKLLKFQHFNIKTQLWDQVMEPFSLHFMVTPILKECLIESDVIDITLSEGLILDTIKFINEIKNRIDNKDFHTSPKIPFLVTNLTHESMLCDFDMESFNIQPSESIAKNFGNESIRFCHEGRVFNLSIDKLFYPQYIRKTTIAYRNISFDDYRIIISSVFVLKNNTPYEFALFVKQKQGMKMIVELPQGEKIGVPCDFDMNSDFYISTLKEFNRPKQLFKFKDIFGSSMNYNIVIEGEKKSVVLRGEVRKDCGVCTLHIDYNCKLVSQIPERTHIYINSDLSILMPGEESKMSIDSDHFEVAIQLSYMKGEPRFETINLKEGTYPVVVETENAPIKFALRIHREESGAFILTAFCPAIIYNMTEVNFSIVNFNKKETASFKRMNGYSFTYWSDDTFFESQSLKLYPFLSMPSITSSDPIECCGISNAMNYFMPMRDDFMIYAPLRYTIKTIDSTQVLSFYSLLYLNNFLPFPLEVFASGSREFSDVFQPGEGRMIAVSDTNMHFLIASIGECEYSELYLGSPTHTTFLLYTNNGTVKVELEIVSDGETMVTSLRLGTIIQPLLISNELDFPIGAFQSGFSPSQFYEQQSTGVFAYNTPFGVSDICIYIKGKDLMFSPSMVNQTVELEGYKIKVVVLHNGSRMVVVSTEEIVSLAPTLFTFRARIPQFSCSVVDNLSVEFVNMTVNEILFEWETNPETTSVDCSIRKIQVDDLHPCAPLEVAALCEPHEKNPCFAVHAVMNNNAPLFSAFNEIRISVAPLRLFMDMAFVNDVMFALSLIKPKKSIAELQPSLGKLNKKTFNTSLMSAQKLLIDPMLVDLVLESTTARPTEYPLLSSPVQTMISGQVRIPFDALELSDFESTPEYIRRNIIDPYKNILKRNAMKLIFNLDLLITPDGHMTKNVANIVSTPLKLSENLLTTTSRVIQKINPDERSTRIGLNKTAEETVSQGFNSLKQGVIRGFTGIVTKPRDGLKKDGMKGMFKGIGQGVVGLVASPTVGIVDVATSLISGSRKFVEGNSDVFKRVREPRAILRHQIGSFNGNAAAIQARIRSICHVQRASHSVVFVIRSKVDGKDYIYVLLKEAVVVLNANGSVHEVIQIGNISAASCAGKTIFLTVGDRPIEIDAGSPNVARVAQQFIQSSIPPGSLATI